MPVFSRFGKAFGELGTHLKGNGFVQAWKKGGAGLAGKRVLADMMDSAVNWATQYPDAKGVVRMNSMGIQMRHPGAIGFLGGIAAGGGATALMNRRDHGNRSVLRGAALGGIAGNLAGAGYLMTRYNAASGMFGNLRGAPGAFMRGLRA